MADFKYIPSNVLYVDALYGDDINPGTSRSAPKRTVASAISVATAGAKIIIGSGSYAHIEPGTVAQEVKLIGDGFVLFDGTGLGAGAAVSKIAEVKNINFYNYGSGNFAVSFRDINDQNLINLKGCGFYGCDFENTLYSSGVVKDCIFQNCAFDGTGPGQQVHIGMQNCSFISCSGYFFNYANFQYGIFNNTYTDCETLTHRSLAGTAPEAIPISKFDYCNIDGQLMYGTQSELRALGTNINGSSFSSSNIFNDYNPARPIAEWWKQSYTQKQSSPTLTSGRNRTHMGRYYKSVHLSATDLWNLYRDDANNTQLNGDVIEVIVSGNPANYRGVDISTAGKLLSRLIVNSSNTYGANGELVEYIFENDNDVTEERSSVNIGVQLTDQTSMTDLAMDSYSYLGFGAEQPDPGDPVIWIGTADTPYLNIAQFNDGIGIPENNSIEIALQIKTI